MVSSSTPTIVPSNADLNIYFPTVFCFFLLCFPSSLLYNWSCSQMYMHLDLLFCTCDINFKLKWQWTSKTTTKKLRIWHNVCTRRRATQCVMRRVYIHYVASPVLGELELYLLSVGVVANNMIQLRSDDCGSTNRVLGCKSKVNNTKQIILYLLQPVGNILFKYHLSGIHTINCGTLVFS